ncbi:hypothetical protein B7P43_G16947, partial [Cryptotermes secundus]
KYMLLSDHQNAGQNHDIKIGKRCFENVAQFRYLGTTITDQNLIQGEIKRSLNSKNIKIRIYKTIILPMVLYGCETWSLTVRKEHNLYSSPSIIRMIKSKRIRWAGHVAQKGETNAYRILVGKPEGKRPVGRPIRSWEDNIKMDLREVGWDGIDWIDLAQDRDQWRALLNMVMNLRVP